MATADTARLVASLTLDDKGFTKGLTNAEKKLGQFESTSYRVGQNIGNGLKSASHNLKILGAVAAGAITTQVIAGVRSLEDLERVENQTAAVIKSTGSAAGVTAKQVRELAEAQENLTTADDKLIQEGENLLLTFTNIGKKTFPVATDAMVNMAIAMADGDVEAADFSATAIQLGKALNDPVKGITALSRVGVSFTKQQKEQIKALTEAGKIEEAQAIILNELEREFGQAGDAAGTGFGADMRRFGDAIEGAQQALARGFLPVLSRVAAVLNERLADPKTIAAIEEFGKGLAGGLDSLISIAEKLPWDAIGTSLQLAGTGARAVLDAFVSLPPWVQTAVLTGWGLNKLTGGALTGIAGELIKGFAGQRGATPANPVFVSAVGGLGGGVPPAAVAGGAGLAAVATVGAVGATAAVVTVVGLNSITDAIAENNRLAGRGLTNDEIIAQRYYTANKRDQDFLFKQLHGRIPPREVFESGNAKLNATMVGGFGGLSQDERSTARAVEQTRDAVHNSASQDLAISAKNQAAAFAIRDKVGTSGSIIAGAVNAVKTATDATKAAAAHAGQQTAAAIRDKDLSVDVRSVVNVSTSVSVKSTIGATHKVNKYTTYL